MKTITISPDDELHERIQGVANQRSISVAELVRASLEHLESGKSDFERLRSAERLLRAEIDAFRASSRASREAIYQRCKVGKAL